MINLILAVLAILIFIILEPFSFIYVVFFKIKFTWKNLSGYWRSFAVSVDRFGNFQYRGVLNLCLIKKEGDQFGDFRETISSVLGKNQRNKTLTQAGKILVKILDFIDKDHCQKSINEL